jgi:hypothetical protein
MDYYGQQSLSGGYPSGSYGGGGGGMGGYDAGLGSALGGTNAPPAAGRSKMVIALVVLFVCSSISLAVYMMTRSSDEEVPSSSSTGTTATTTATATTTSSGGGKASLRAGEERVPDRDDDIKYATFAFEHLTRAYHVPTLTGTIVRKPPANPPYKLVPCAGEGMYAVRWQGKFLTLDRDNLVVKWTDERVEPQSCWRVVPGYCGNDEFILLRSVANNMVLRPDGASGQLVVKDIPTARTAKDFCWKLVGRTPGQPVSTDCGCQYDYEKARVVCIPCGDAKTPAPSPPPGGKGPSFAPTAAPGAVAPTNLDAAARQLIGHDVRSSVQYLQRASPGATVIAIPRNDVRRQEYAALKMPESLAVVYEPASMKTMSIGISKQLFAPSGQIAL